MKKLPLLLAGMFVWIAFFPSCTTVNTVERASSIGEKKMIDDKRVITDSTLNRKVNIVGLNESITKGGFLKVQAEVHNQKNSMQSFNYRFEWFDMEGMLVDTPTSVWIPRQIAGQETLSITAVAPTPSVRDFRLKFIEDVRD